MGEYLLYVAENVKPSSFLNGEPSFVIKIVVHYFSGKNRMVTILYSILYNTQLQKEKTNRIFSYGMVWHELLRWTTTHNPLVVYLQSNVYLEIF